MKFLDFLKENGLDYKGQHGAPDHESGSPLFDLTKNKTYPKDFYETMHHYNYGEKDEEYVNGIIMQYRNKQNSRIKIYRSVPKDVGKVGINKGDWVTIVRSYARSHGKANLNNSYKIISKVVYARDIFTAGDSLMEWGYDPQPEDPKYRYEVHLKRYKKYRDKILAGDKISIFDNITPEENLEYINNKIKELSEKLNTN